MRFLTKNMRTMKPTHQVTWTFGGASWRCGAEASTNSASSLLSISQSRKFWLKPKLYEIFYKSKRFQHKRIVLTGNRSICINFAFCSMFDLERTVLLVYLRRWVVMSAASWSVARPAKGGAEPIIFRTTLQWQKWQKQDFHVFSKTLSWPWHLCRRVQAVERLFSFLIHICRIKQRQGRLKRWKRAC